MLIINRLWSLAEDQYVFLQLLLSVLVIVLVVLRANEPLSDVGSPISTTVSVFPQFSELLAPKRNYIVLPGNRPRPGSSRHPRSTSPKVGFYDTPLESVFYLLRSYNQGGSRAGRQMFQKIKKGCNCYLQFGFHSLQRKRGRIPGSLEVVVMRHSHVQVVRSLLTAWRETNSYVSLLTHFQKCNFFVKYTRGTPGTTSIRR